MITYCVQFDFDTTTLGVETKIGLNEYIKIRNSK